MSEHALQRARRIVEAAAARLESDGRMDRRDFVRAVPLLAAALAAACDSHGPRGAQRVLRWAERRNERLEGLLLRHTSMNRAPVGARDAGTAFPRYFVSDVVPVWNEAARGPWSLRVDGLVQRPLRLTQVALRRLPAVRQRVDHFCVEGWTAVATWEGVRVAELARLAGALPAARYVDFRSFDDDYHESWDLESATHPQSLVAYAMDGRLLGPAHGAPARLHSPLKLGYKSVKYLTGITFMPERNGGYWSDQGYEWYAGT
jgi:DMSO/TMAO reductase YedYZ molybdopterin-dependent catalytic subunit